MARQLTYDAASARDQMGRVEGKEERGWKDRDGAAEEVVSARGD